LAIISSRTLRSMVPQNDTFGNPVYCNTPIPYFDPERALTLITGPTPPAASFTLSCSGSLFVLTVTTPLVALSQYVSVVLWGVPIGGSYSVAVQPGPLRAAMVVDGMQDLAQAVAGEVITLRVALFDAHNNSVCALGGLCKGGKARIASRIVGCTERAWFFYARGLDLSTKDSSSRRTKTVASVASTRASSCSDSAA